MLLVVHCVGKLVTYSAKKSGEFFMKFLVGMLFLWVRSWHLGVLDVSMWIILHVEESKFCW